MSSKRKPMSVSEKISDLLTAAPKIIDSDDDFEVTKAKVVDFDDEIDVQDDVLTGLKDTNIRKRNVGLLEETDKRYAGKKVSKKDIFDDGLSSEGSDDGDLEDEDLDKADITDQEEEESELEENGSVGNSEEEESELEENGSVPSNSEEEESQNENDQNDDSDDEENDGSDAADEDDESDMDDMDESIDLANPLRRERNNENSIKTVSDTNVRAEIEKGNCVRRQLKIWEDLVEMRIRFQKCLVAGNIMPQHDIYKNYTQNSQFKKGCNNTKNNLSQLLNNLLSLQSSLLGQFSETKDLSIGKKRKLNNDEESDNPMDEEIPSDTDDETNEKDADCEEDNDENLSNESESEDVKEPAKKKMKLTEFEKIIDKNHKAYGEYRDSVIRKWNDKTKLASGVISKGPIQPITRQIEFLLSNKEKLRKKTQLKRMNYEIIGKASSEDKDGRRVDEYDTEIFDDNDFYQQILKEMIECKTAGIEDPIKLGQEWAKLQNMRKKMKRKIDTRATKGRRVRYDVHQKLVNYMGPITVFDRWTDHSKNELYSSLFGKMKSVSQAKQDSNPT